LSDIPGDLRQFAQRTANGEFYEAFMVDGRWTRDELKPRVFQIIYGHKGVMQNAELSRTFEAIFPTAYGMLLKLKAEKGHKWVGTELQRRESGVIIKGVCNRLRVEHPDVPVVTVHDSLMTTEEHLELVQELLRREFGRFPMLPRFRVKVG
jgi:hypothetical protein